MRLALCTWQEVEQYLERSATIIIPIGSTEQHGPTGLIGTDSLTADRIARAVGDTGQTLVGPAINVGMAQHHLGFPGTISLRPSTLLAYLVDYIESLAVHGLRRFYFLNGHGGNSPTLSAAFSEVYAARSFRAGHGNDHPSVVCGFQNWWTGSRVREVSKRHFSGVEGSHATPSEISLTYFLYPEAQKNAAVSPAKAPSGYIRDANDYRSRFPDGRIGSDPRGASPEIGAELFEAAVADVVEDLRRFESSG